MKPPRWSFVAIFFAFLSLAAAQQEQVWPVLANGPALAVDPVTQRVMVTNTAGGCCTINAVQTFDFAALGYSVSGSLSGDLGNIGPNSVLSFSCTTSPPNLVAYTAWTPGVHIVTTSLSPCDGGDAGIVYSGSLQIIVPPVSPAPAGPGCSPTLVDPVNSIPNLLDGNAITTDQRRLAGSSNFTVTGVSADGVTEALVTIPANHVGDNIQISVINDAGSPSSSSAQDGGLMPIGGSSTSLSGTQYLVASDPLNTGQPVAFAIYVAPVNYARGTQDFPQDNKSIQRQVSFQVFCPGSSGSIGSPT
ncbi:MAG TPA: hypothetical protein VND65_16775, partial [Candidatus Binatia bacterium]|nr:hypothetical protein [Candidatus Binatia bacterium]